GLGQTGIGADEPLDILAVVDPSGVHDEGLFEAIALPDSPLLVWQHVLSPEPLIHISRDVDRTVLGELQVRHEVLPGSLRDGQAQVRALQVFDLLRIPSLDDRILEVWHRIEIADQVVMDDRDRHSMRKTVDARYRVIGQTFEQARYQYEVRFLARQECLIRELRNLATAFVNRFNVSDGPRRTPHANVSLRHELLEFGP